MWVWRIFIANHKSTSNYDKEILEFEFEKYLVDNGIVLGSLD